MQLWSLYGFLNRHDHEDLPLRHEGMSTFDELQLRHQHGFLHCLTISMSLRNTGTTTLSKNCTRTEKNTVGTCLCSTTGMSTILSRNTKNSKSCWNLSLKITGTSTSTARKFFLPLLLPLPLWKRGCVIQESLLPPPQLRSPLLVLLLLFLLLLKLLPCNVRLEEVSEGATIDGFSRSVRQRWHTQERSLP